MEEDTWSWLKDKTVPTTPPPPLPGPSPAAQRSQQSSHRPDHPPPPVPGQSPTASQPTSTPPKLPGPSPAARSAVKSIEATTVSTASTSPPSIPARPFDPAPAPGPIDAPAEIAVDAGLLRLAETTAKCADALHLALIQQLSMEQNDAPAASSTMSFDIVDEEGEEVLVPMGDDEISARSFLHIVGFISSSRGLSCLRTLSQVCTAWRAALQPSLFVLRSVRGLLTYYGSRRGSTEEVNTTTSISAESSRRSSTESAPAPSAAAAAAGMAIINRGLQGLQGFTAMRAQEQERAAQAALAGRVEEMERTAAGLKAEREQLFAHVQEGALQKKAYEAKIAELQNMWDRAEARGERPVEEGQCRGCAEAEESLEAVEAELAVATGELREAEATRAREKKLLVAEVQRLRERLRPAGSTT